MPHRHCQKCINVTVTLTPLEFDHMVDHGMFCLSELADLGIVKAFMPAPRTLDAARDVAIFGVQEMIGTCVYRSRHLPPEDCLEDEIPF